MKKLFLFLSLLPALNNIHAQNVGIGVATPTQKLDVAGNVKYSGAIMPGSNAGNIGQPLLSAGGATNTWGPAILNSSANLGMGKFYVNGVTILANTILQVIVTDPSTVAGSYIGCSFVGPLPGTPAQLSKLSILYSQSGAGQWMVFISNANAGTNFTNLSLVFWAVY